jgi:hypothetical protein
MFEATSEQQSPSSVIVVSSSVATPAPTTGPVSALNEVLVDAIGHDNHHLHHIHHTHHHVLHASYYYCSNLLELRSHFNQTMGNLGTNYSRIRASTTTLHTAGHMACGNGHTTHDQNPDMGNNRF